MTAALLVVTSVAVYGVDAWMHYLYNLDLLRTVILQDGTGVSHRMVSVFVFARHFGADAAISYASQAVGALIAAVFIARSWWSDKSAHIRNAVLIIGTCLATPSLQDYDLVFGAFVVLWLQIAEKDSKVPLRWIRVAMAMILLPPLVSAPLAIFVGPSVGPLVFLPVFVILIQLGSQYRKQVWE